MFIIFRGFFDCTFLDNSIRHGFAVPPPLPKEANVNSRLTAMGSLEKELSVGLRIDFAI